MTKTALLALADGTLFQGESVGFSGTTVGEIIFNTSMTGYQEIITDPSYKQQIITFTYPHIGNVGVNELDVESNSIHAAGIVLNEMSPMVSNWRATSSLDNYLKDNEIVAIAGIDTRALTHILRKKGALGACIIAGSENDAESALAKARSFSGLHGKDLAAQVSTQTSYQWTKGSEYPKGTVNEKTHHVVVYDFGIKQNILRLLADRGCQLTVVPAQTPAEEVLSLNPDGIFLSNGPGDPAACTYAIDNVSYFLKKNIPLFGICLGFQILALAMGANTKKMKFGHHGANHPVRCEKSQRVFISSQNHGFEVCADSLPESLKVTHRSLFDGSLQGVEHISKSAFGFQGHPEANPGPHDLYELFDKFIKSFKSDPN